VALDFPELVIMAGHIGYPWTTEMIALATKYPNVYNDTSAYKSGSGSNSVIVVSRAFACGRSRSRHPGILSHQQDRLGQNNSTTRA